MPEPLMVKNVFGWDHFIVYLSGPIDFDKYAKDWREEWSQKLCGIGVRPSQIFNPCKKPLIGAQFNLDNESEIMHKHRNNREWSELCEIMSQIVHIDLRMTDKSDLILVNFPKAGQQRYQKLTDQFEKAIGNIEGNVDAVKSAYYGLLAEISQHRVPTYGTMHEIVRARQNRKPVMVVWEGGKETCSAWVMWLVGHRNVFGSIDEVITRLDNISKGKTAYNARDWLLLNLGQDGAV